MEKYKRMRAKYDELFRKHLSITPYNEQYKASLEIVKGNIVEMATGEGKTVAILLATLMLCEKGRKVYICTSNDYLAKRDFEYSQSIFRELGIHSIYIKEALGLTEIEYKNNNVFYTQGSTLIFDYLRGVKADYDFVIIDEVDDILVSCANHDFNVSNESSQISIDVLPYKKALALCKILSTKEIPYKYKKEEHLFDMQNEYDILLTTNTKNHEITERGYDKIVSLLGVNESEMLDFVEILNMSIYATYFCKKDEQYIIKDGKLVIIEETNGRISPNGSHGYILQTLLEIKENLQVTPKALIHNSCSYPVFFSLFKNLSGLSGTASCFCDDFEKIYRKKVVRIKEHNKCRRTTKYLEFENEQEKIDWLNEVLNKYKEHPILIFADTDSKANFVFSNITNTERKRILTNKNLPLEQHLLLELEETNAILVSSKILGRGTDVDIKGERELIVILFCRFLSKSVERQAIGRTGRNGKSGTVYILTSADEIVCKGKGKKLLRRVERNHKEIERKEFEARKDLYLKSKLYFDQTQALKSVFSNFSSYGEIVCNIENNLQNCFGETRNLAMRNLALAKEISEKNILLNDIQRGIFSHYLDSLLPLNRIKYYDYAESMMSTLKNTDGFHEFAKFCKKNTQDVIQQALYMFLLTIAKQVWQNEKE